MTTFSKRLKQARTAAGISQERLGIDAGLEPASASARMNQYEKGVHSPGESTAKQIADTLGLPLAWFYCEDEETAYLLQCFHSLKGKERKKAIEMVERLALGG
ncbi:hypothetical protein AEQ67_28320 [Pseudomonas sp. RIT-PI-q]|uniref:helix-turn-helix domain-containing protein n=1 Tax=Pseudomonas sp. RIT-PI-q TaxID=1690247 RepID=UPI0006CDE20A|nr:helix-turn-helix transcriptional regulator [Pseudomonas sp. RIT-PI-q]KPG91893.1 hypothetical protein AEQ67_28320 [Pseudomonas sp. RIT-PI-q]